MAVRSYRDFIENYPDSRFVANARYKMACVTFSEERYDESVRQLEEIVRLFPGEMIGGYAQYLIGDCYMTLDRRAEAIFAWTDAVRRFEGSRVASAALHKIIYAYSLEENHGQAIVLAEEFLRTLSRRQPGPPRAGAAGLQPLPAGGVPRSDHGLPERGRQARQHRRGRARALPLDPGLLPGRTSWTA